MSRVLKQSADFVRYLLGAKHPLYGPPKVSWLVTDGCNCKCVHCTYWHNGLERPTLPREVEDSILDSLEIMGTYHIAFSGGEMFLKKDMVELIERCKARGFVISGNSNGLMIGAELARRLGKAGMDSLTLSLDGGTPETHDQIRGVKGCFKQVLAAIGHIREQAPRCSVFLNLTINHYNIHEITLVARSARELGVKGLSLQPINYFAPFNPPDDPNLPILKEDMPALTAAIEEIIRDYSDIVIHPPDYLRNITTFLTDPDSLYRYKCAAGYYFLQIMETGDVSPCPVQFTTIGNVKERPLHEIWHSPRANSVREDICAGKHPMCWLSCIAPINIVLDSAQTLKFRNLLSPAVLQHIKGNLSAPST